MSKNFELLQRVAKDDLFRISDGPVLRPKIAPPLTPLPKVTQAKTRPVDVLKKARPETEITKLVQRLFAESGKHAAPQIVSFSGISQGDRSSWICARAGEALAEQGAKSVCIVDADLKNPQLHLHMGVENSLGFAEALASKEPICTFATPLAGANFWLIPSGVQRVGFRPSVERYRERIADLREAFDYVLISLPAIAREAEATLIGQLTDGLVLIVEANRSRRETVRRVKEELEGAQVRLLGAVLDQRTFPIPEALYQRL